MQIRRPRLTLAICFFFLFGKRRNLNHYTEKVRITCVNIDIVGGEKIHEPLVGYTLSLPQPGANTSIMPSLVPKEWYNTPMRFLAKMLAN